MSILFVLFSCGDDAAGRAGGAENESFSLWCGDRPCAWEVEEGVVEPVPTWHSKDQGIGFLSDPAQISQVVDLDSVSCITLSLLADLEEDAVFFWKVDFNNDGFDETLDGVVKISDNNWKTQYREMRVPDGTTTARSIFEKQGKGRVVLSTSHFMGDYYCASNPPPLSPDPDGGEE